MKKINWDNGTELSEWAIAAKEGDRCTVEDDDCSINIEILESDLSRLSFSGAIFFYCKKIGGIEEYKSDFFDWIGDVKHISLFFGDIIINMSDEDGVNDWAIEDGDQELTFKFKTKYEEK